MMTWQCSACLRLFEAHRTRCPYCGSLIARRVSQFAGASPSANDEPAPKLPDIDTFFRGSSNPEREADPFADSPSSGGGGDSGGGGASADFGGGDSS